MPPVLDIKEELNNFELIFPDNFDKKLGKNIECGFYAIPENYNYFKNYVDLLILT